VQTSSIWCTTVEIAVTSSATVDFKKASPYTLITRQRYIEHTNPRIRFVLDVTVRRSFVRVYAHKQSANLCKLDDEPAVLRDESSDRLIVAEVAEIAEHGHESFGFKRETIDVHLGAGIRRLDDMLSFDLIGKERGDDGQ
jgi:hypothetical protein